MIVLIVFFFLISSCNNSNKNNDIKTWKNYINTQFDTYKNIYKEANDSINKWTSDSLQVVQSYLLYESQLDSIFIFNKAKDRFYTVNKINASKDKIAIADAYDDFGGAKINGKWYFFFMGVSHPVRREDWQDSVYAPLSFDELSYVAYESHFKTLVKNINEGKLEKNEEIFKKKMNNKTQCFIRISVFTPVLIMFSRSKSKFI